MAELPPTARRAAAALLLAGLLAGCADEAEPGPAPERVLLIVIDATHAAHLSSYGGPEGLTPQLDALAARGVRFSRALSNNTWTLPSTTSLLTGQLQEAHGVVTNKHRVDERHELLPELFAEAGYETAAFSEMIYASAVHGLDRGFDHPRYYSITAGAHPDTLFRDATRWMDERADGRWFAYVHLRRPHSPYDPSRLAMQRLGAAPPGSHPDDGLLAHADSKVQAPLSDEQDARLLELYRGNLANVDDQLADMLRRAADDDGMLVVLTSDHGEALGQHGSYGHGYELHAECVDIPSIWAGPGIAPGVDDTPVSTVDVTPTLVELCDLPRPSAALDGTSLAPRLTRGAPARARPIPFSARYNVGNTPAQGVRLGSLKLVLAGDGSYTLHDLDSDPDERHDLAASRPDDAARLLELARARRALGAELADRDRVDIPAHEAELRALGYLK